MSANMNGRTAYTATYNPTYHSTVLLAGRILMALLFLIIGFQKLMGYAGTVAYFAKLGFPVPELTAVVAIIFELGGGILLIIGWRTRWVAWLLVLYVVIATAVAHRYWTYDAAQTLNQTYHFYKNVSIIGGLLYIAAMGAGRYSVDKT